MQGCPDVEPHRTDNAFARDFPSSRAVDISNEQEKGNIGHAGNDEPFEQVIETKMTIHTYGDGGMRAGFVAGTPGRGSECPNTLRTGNVGLLPLRNVGTSSELP